MFLPGNLFFSSGFTGTGGMLSQRSRGRLFTAVSFLDLDHAIRRSFSFPKKKKVGLNMINSEIQRSQEIFPQASITELLFLF